MVQRLGFEKAQLENKETAADIEKKQAETALTEEKILSERVQSEIAYKASDENVNVSL